MTNEKSNMGNGKSRVPVSGGLRIVVTGFSIYHFPFEIFHLHPLQD
jgi:hypothetical protein